MKIFLSHSSSDKDIVEKVYKELGAGICHYDVATFDPVGFLPDQIYSALSESTHFVLFASEKALASPWVQGELKSLFINWMRSKTPSVMAFLLRGGNRSLIPDWLQSHVITEHPTPTHITCRILSDYDRWQNNESNIPPFYRTDEAKNIERRLTVEAAKMPACLLICGPDGSGRKELINQVFSRIFRNVSLRKIHIYTEKFDSDVDFYKSLNGVFSLNTAREFADALDSYKSLPLEQRLDQLVEIIEQLCTGSQTIILDATDSIFDDAGEINNWMELLIKKLPSTSYPYLNITTNRRPNYIKSFIEERTVICYLEPLTAQDSSLLFRWWLNKEEISLSSYIEELVLEQVAGNPKQIEFAVRLLKNIPDLSDTGIIKKNIFSDLERNASKLIISFASDDLSKLILSLVADCGHIAISDLLTIIQQVTGQDNELIRSCYKKLCSYGLIQSDDICLKVPNFLIRTAKLLGKAEPITTQLKSYLFRPLNRLQNNKLKIAKTNILSEKPSK